MATDQEAFLRELLNDFKVEADEHYQAILKGLLELEKGVQPDDQKNIVETVFREVHSLKGAARAVNQLDIEKLCMSLEGVFHSLKQGFVSTTPQMFDAMYKALEVLKKLFNQIDHQEARIPSFELTRLMKILESFLQNTAPVGELTLSGQSNQVDTQEAVMKPDPLPTDLAAESVSRNQSDHETIRIATIKLYDLLRQAEEMITVKSTMNFYVREMQNLGAQYATWNRKGVDGADPEFAKKHEADLFNLGKKLEQFHRSAAQTIDNLLLDIKTTLLFPFSSLLAIVPKIVRDLGKQFNKEIDLKIAGGEIEIDRRILEEIKDPLIHLIRNSIDHGIEPASERLQQGKKPAGVIQIIITMDSGYNIQIAISDDGRGIDKIKVVNSAVKSGAIKVEEAAGLSENDIFNLIFSSGVSTSQFITDISGRGIGMAIVAEKVGKLGGSIKVQSQPGAGTRFEITLPQTLATFRGILTRASEQYFIIPTTSIVCAIQVELSDVKTVESRKIIFHNGESVALVSLAEVLRLPVRRSVKGDRVKVPVMILAQGQKKVAFIVDEVLGEQEGIVKDLGPQLPDVTNIEGVTLMGSGRIVPILHIPELIESAVHADLTSSMIKESSVEPKMEETEPGRVLVAEDSFTVRSMLRNFIENAGYTVFTAVDGQEAFDFLQNELVDIVVSDVEMPRMNGFELTAKIRENIRFADLPVILVTALDSADDRQRGMEAGANAYIVKSSFEQSNLIETINRLI